MYFVLIFVGLSRDVIEEQHSTEASGRKRNVQNDEDQRAIKYLEQPQLQNKPETSEQQQQGLLKNYTIERGNYGRSIIVSFCSIYKAESWVILMYAGVCSSMKICQLHLFRKSCN